MPSSKIVKARYMEQNGRATTFKFKMFLDYPQVSAERANPQVAVMPGRRPLGNLSFQRWLKLIRN
jgi:hypothetical protein